MRWSGYEELQWVAESAFAEEDLMSFKRRWVRVRVKIQRRKKRAKVRRKDEIG